MPKLFTGLNVGHIEARHRLVMDVPFRVGLAAASELVRRSGSLRGGALIHELGSTLRHRITWPAADFLARSVVKAHDKQQSVIARVRVSNELWERSAAWARAQGYDGVELDLAGLVSRETHASERNERVAELLGNLPAFLDRNRLGLRISARALGELALLRALRSAGEYEVAYVHLSGLPVGSVAWLGSSRATCIRRAFPGVLIAGGCPRLSSACLLVQSRWADAISVNLCNAGALGLFSEFKEALERRVRSRNGSH